jgi:hypothetical protein
MILVRKRVRRTVSAKIHLRQLDSLLEIVEAVEWVGLVPAEVFEVDKLLSFEGIRDAG